MTHEITTTKNAADLALRRVDEKLKQLTLEEEGIKSKLTHIKKYDANINALRQYERTQHTAEKARELERKRRLLTKTEGKRTGAPPPEQLNIYDYYATKIQALSRGFISRQWSVFYQENCNPASVGIQRIVRGFLGRRRVQKIHALNRGATGVQRIFRGVRARVSNK
jgi:hypothetical protein